MSMISLELEKATSIAMSFICCSLSYWTSLYLILKHVMLKFVGATGSKCCVLTISGFSVSFNPLYEGYRTGIFCMIVIVWLFVVSHPAGKYFIRMASLLLPMEDCKICSALLVLGQGGIVPHLLWQGTLVLLHNVLRTFTQDVIVWKIKVCWGNLGYWRMLMNK